MKSVTVHFFPISSICAGMLDLKTDAFPTSACMEIFGRRSTGVSSARRAQALPDRGTGSHDGFWILMEKFEGFSFVWEAAMCQHAALSVRVTFFVCFWVRARLRVCARMISSPARSSKHLNLRANYRKIHSKLKVTRYGSSLHSASP